jgi:hypothetical protein
MNRQDWYERVNAAWPAGPLPKLTMEEAVKACRRLFRFCGVTVPHIQPTSGNRHNWGRYGTFYVNVDKGWHALVHGVSHWAHYLRTRGTDVAPHDKSHARLELRLVRQVVKRGWLAGRLKRQPKPEAPPPAPADVRSRKLEHARAMLAKADTRLKRATTIRRKWARKVAGLERAAQKLDQPAIAC